MWGKRNRVTERAGDRERPDDWGACEYLDDRETRPPGEGRPDDSLGWRAARHGRPQDWLSPPPGQAERSAPEDMAGRGEPDAAAPPSAPGPPTA